MEVSDLLYRCYGLVGIAGVMVEAGQRERAKHIADQALHVAKSLEDKDERSGWISEVARVMAKAGQFDKALQVAKGGDNKYLAWIAEEMAKDDSSAELCKLSRGPRTLVLTALLNIIKEMAKRAIRPSHKVSRNQDPQRCKRLSCVAAAMAMADSRNLQDNIYPLTDSKGIKARYERNFVFHCCSSLCTGPVGKPYK